MEDGARSDVEDDVDEVTEYIPSLHKPVEGCSLRGFFHRFAGTSQKRPSREPRVAPNKAPAAPSRWKWPCSSACPSPDAILKLDQLYEPTLKYRIVISMAAVSLMWMTSLAVALDMAAMNIKEPAVTQVYDTCKYAYDKTRTERRAYTKCVELQTSQCDLTFAEALNTEIESVNTALEKNREALEEYEAIQGSCSFALTEAQRALSVWQALDTGNKVPYGCEDGNSDCFRPCDAYSGQECSCAQVADGIGDVAAVRTAAFSSTTQYAAKSKTTVSGLSDYIIARSRYDREYVANKTARQRLAVGSAIRELSAPFVALQNLTLVDVNLGFEELYACTTLRTNGSAPCGLPLINARDQIETYAFKWADTVRDLQEDMLNNVAFAEQFQERVEVAFSNIYEFYSGVTNWIREIKVDVPTDDWFNFNINDFYAAPLYILPFEGPSWPQPDWEDMYTTAMEGVYDDFAGTLAETASQLKTDTANFVDQLADDVAFIDALTPNDYNPPVYGGSETEIENVTGTHDALTDQYVRKQAVSLNAFAQLSLDVREEDTFPDYNFSNKQFTFNSDYSFLTEWESLAETDYDYKLILHAWISIADLLIILDYVWRAYHTLVIIKRFMNRSALKLPEPDMRNDKDDEILTTSNPGRVFPSEEHTLVDLPCRPRAIAFQIFFHTFTSFALLVLFLVFIIIAAAGAYIPLYRDYVDVCVDGAGDKNNGTFLAQNLFSVSFNYASVDGRSMLADALENYDTNRAQQCSLYATTSSNKADENQLFAESLVSSHQSTAATAYQLYGCIDTAALDANFTYHCCDELGYAACGDGATARACPFQDNGAPFEPIGAAYLSHPACNVSANAWLPLEDSEFDCEATPPCEVTCNGPSRELLREVTQQCACTVEWWFHSSWLKFAVAMCIYVLMNCARLLAVQGVCRLSWRSATPPVFTFIANCDPSGRTLVPKTENGLDGDEKTFKRNLRSELRRRLIRYEAFAWFLLFAAFALNVPWVVFLILIGENIEYDPNSGR